MDLLGQKGVIWIVRPKVFLGILRDGNYVIYYIVIYYAHICNSSIQPNHECSYRLMLNFGHDSQVDIAYFKVF